MTPCSFILTGNPNSGKTTLFNALTGASQKTGNWSGVTVEVKSGTAKVNGRTLTFSDLPGIYSLSATSEDERLARDFLFAHPVDILINVVDATNLERNLYLTVQLLEMNRPLILVLNMADELERKGIQIDVPELSALLKVPVLLTNGRKEEGVRELLETALRLAGQPPGTFQPFPFPYLQNEPMNEEDRGTRLTEQRYGFINGLLKATLKRPAPDRLEWSDRIDSVLMHPVLAYPLFGLFMWLLFTLTFTLGAYPMSAIDSLFHLLAKVAEWLPFEGAAKSLLVNGIITGVGNVMVFLPNILILFFGISILEDTGYMARAAFIMDKGMHKMGLHGKSFIPMVMGLGCNVPAIMAARTLESRSDRILTILITPLITCSARLPIYVLFAGALFGRYAGHIVFLLYLISFLSAFLAGLLFRKLFFSGDNTPFVLELPPYRVPTVKGVFIHMWERARHYVKRIGTVVLLGSVIMWVASTYPKGETGHPESTLLGRVGQSMTPVLTPIGFDWKMGVSLLSGFAAKEMVVSTLCMLFQDDTGRYPENNALRQSIRLNYSRLTAFAFMLFVLLYTPCLASLMTLFREIHSPGWALFGFCYPIIFAYGAAFLVFQGGGLILRFIQ
ncbi:MAG: ferrous iron transport protein B [Elusimicrobia bacterium RIFOXYB2_FULL_49_7]|nr:MAG: ferrous iron transport protein B [Elusimicrobia bacterium RIFOXYB2_FULL_49_7]